MATVKGISAFFLVLFLGFSGPTARATSFLQIPFPESVSDAPAIVRGTVGNSYSDWGKGVDHSKRIYTFTELQIAEVFKGSVSGRNLIVRELGGAKDGMGMEVAGAARFSRGEDVVVFLGDSNTDGSRDVRGLMMGKYMVERDNKGTEYLSGPGLGLAGGDGHVVHGDENSAGQGDTNRWTLDALRKVIRAQSDKTDSVGQQKDPPKSLPPSQVSPIPSPIFSGVAASSPAAPVLQPSPVGEGLDSTSNTSRPWLPWMLAGLAVLGLAAIFLSRTRK